MERCKSYSRFNILIMTTFKPEFETKLIELGIKEKFMANYEADDSPLHLSVEQLNECKNWKTFISCAFYWNRKDLAFWDEISLK